MTSQSHMFVNGIQYLTGIANTGAGGLATWTQKPWYGDITGTYSGGYRCGLSTTYGTYTSSTNEGAITEITGTNYSALGVAIDGASHNQLLTSLQATNVIEFYSNQTDSSPKWTTLTETTAAFAPIFASSGTAATSPLLCVFDLSGAGTAYQCTAGTFTITFGTDNTQTGSVFKIQVS